MPRTATHRGAQLAQLPQSPPPRFAWLRRNGGLLALVLLAAAVRLPGVNRPLVGHFATKSVFYAMIARNWVMGRSPVWYPAIDCMTGGERGWHLLEFPVAAYLAGAGWACFGGSLDVWGRATCVAFSAGSVLMLFSLVRRWHGLSAAYGAAVTLALAPVAIIFGQCFMLESSLVFFSVATIGCLDQWLARRERRWLALAAVSFALLLLTKIYMLVLILPLAAMARREPRVGPWGGSRRRWIEFIVAGALAATPALVWCANVVRVSAPNGPLSQRVFYSLRQSAAVHQSPQELLVSPTFHRKLLDDLTGPVLTPLGFVLCIVGLTNPAWRRHVAWLASMAVLVAALPAKFHDILYYDVVLLPPLCILTGLGWQRVAERLRVGRMATVGLLSVAMLLSLRYAVGPAFLTPPEDRGVTAAAAALRGLAGIEEPVLTMHGWCPDLLYYCDRPGWAVSPDDPRLPERFALARRHGTRWCVATNLEAIDRCPLAISALADWEVVHEGDDFRVYSASGPYGVQASERISPNSRGGFSQRSPPSGE
ncbi:MAG TPA: glycosyltransferase family 39 protein [Pirellulales bacterium]|nr:glycosyltransferase family 39 protein [Pirellulales bacterium]